MRLAKRHGTKLEINMTPMIDVTFLLLIFFMTVNQVSKAQRERVALPQLAGSQGQSQQALVINVDRFGQIVVAANSVTLPELMGVVSGEIARLAKQHQELDRLTVILRADRDGNCRTVNDIVTALT